MTIETVTFHCPSCQREATVDLIALRDYSTVHFACCGTSALYEDPAVSARIVKEEKHRQEAPERKAFCRTCAVELLAHYSYDNNIRLSPKEAWELSGRLWDAKPGDL